MPATPTLFEGASCHFFYNGSVSAAGGAAGVGQEVEIDLTVLPLALREDPVFRDNFRAIVRQVSVEGITNVSEDVEFEPADPADGAVETAILTMDIADVTNILDLEGFLIHSVVR